MYALLYALSLVFEIAYAFDRYGHSALWGAAIGVLPLVIATSMLALRLDLILTRNSRGTGLFAAIGVFLVATTILLAGTSMYLPNSPITLSDQASYPAVVAYLKDVSYYLPLGLLYLVIPFHLVVALQRALQDRQHRMVLALLSGDGRAVAPRGAYFPKPGILGAIMAAIGMLSVVMTTNLFDHLARGPYRTLFMSLVLLRTVIYFLLGLECLIWYGRALSELKRECLAVLKVPGSDLILTK
jgi:hypothetical protein